MTEVEQPRVIEDLMASPRSRKQFLAGSAALAATLGLAPGVVAAEQMHGGGVGGGTGGLSETPQTILNIAATAEAAAVTALFHVHQAVDGGKLGVAGIAVPVPTLVGIVRAILRQEQDHYAFITGAGGKPLATSFSFPPDIFRSALAAVRFLELADTIFTAAYMAANREFAASGAAILAQYAYQIGGVECEHRALARAAQGKLPNNKSYESNWYKDVGGAAQALTRLGILKPNMPYPGARAVDHILASKGDKDVTAGVISRHP